MLAYHSRETRDVRGLLGALPLSGGVLLLATLAILGSPPFGLFLSELTIVRAGFSLSNPALPALLLILLAIAFLGLARTTTGMITGPSPGRLQAYTTRSQRVLAGLPLVAGLGGLLLLGVWIPGGLNHAIMSSIGAIS